MTRRQPLSWGVLLGMLLDLLFGTGPLLGADSTDAPPRRSQASVIAAEVPKVPLRAWLCRPGAHDMSLSLFAQESLEFRVAWGLAGRSRLRHSEWLRLEAGQTRVVPMTGLQVDRSYAYAVATRGGASGDLGLLQGTFHTQRSKNSRFTVALQADSHLDTGTDVRLYEQTLVNIRADAPDFLIDLGDTTMVDKFGGFYTRAESQYIAQRHFLGAIAGEVSVLMVLGNHDGEKAERLNGHPDSMPLWSLRMRKKYFPNPEPGGLYSGNRTARADAGLLQDYYAWEWGNALFVVLDPFWFTLSRRRDDPWAMTLGEEQHRWLASVLEASSAPFKLVFIHHLVGGRDREVRGGAAIAPFMEWGGRNADGSDGFGEHRPGWSRPIHALLQAHGVSAVFHGHDHLFATERLDGIVYQAVPQPGHPRANARSAREYGYSGEIREGSGHLRLRIGPREAEVEFVRAAVPGVTASGFKNAEVAHRYRLEPKVALKTKRPSSSSP